MSETAVGSIVGFMRLEAQQFHAEMAKAIAEVETLDGKNVNVKVDTKPVERLGTSSRKTSGDVDQLSRATDRAARSNEQAAKSIDKVNASNEKATRSSGMLATAILGLGPGLIPLTGLAVGAGAALGAMGASGILAFKGIQAEIKGGTAAGKTYTGVMLEAKAMLGQLESTAARNVLAPTLSAVSLLRGQMPELNGEVASFSTMLGKVAGSTLTGLVAAFHTLQPLIRDVSVYFVGLSSRMAAFAGGNGFQTFVAWMQSNLPAAEHALEAIVEAAIKLVAAFAPLGGGVLQMVTALADAINAMPVGVLQALATLGVSAMAGFKTWGLLSGGVKALGSALEFVGVSAESAAAGMSVLTAAAGVIGVAVAAVSLVLAHNAEANRQAQQAANEYAEALRQSNGVINESIRLKAFQTLQDNGAIDAAKRLGISLNLVTSASLGNKAASADLATEIQRVVEAQNEADAGGKKTGRTAGETNDALVKLTQGVGTNTEAFMKGTSQQKDWAAANKSGADQTTVQQRILATTTLALERYRLAHLSSTHATQEDAKAIQALNQAMDMEISRALTLAGATSGYDMAVLNMTETLKKNGRTLREDTKAGVENRQAIEATVSALQQKRSQEIQTGTSAAKATAEYEKNSRSLLDQMGKLYGTKSAAYAYAQQLLAVPKNVNTTLGLNGAGAAIATLLKIQTMLGQIHGKTIDVIVRSNNVTASVQASNRQAKIDAGSASANGNLFTPFANGGVENHVAQIARPGEYRLWAEDETGGEAYIPLAQSKRPRSTAILSDVARRFGMQVVPNANGSIMSFAAGAAVTPDFSGIMSLIPQAPTYDTVTSARSRVASASSSIASIHLQQAAAARSLASAEANLNAVLARKHHTHAQVLSAENAIANARDRERALTSRLAAAEGNLAVSRSKLAQATAAYRAGQLPYATRFVNAENARNRVTSAFLSNIATLEKRGFHALAVDLLNQGGAEAETLAAQAVRSTGTARAVQAGLVTSSNLQAQADKLKAQLNGTASSVGWFQPGTNGQIGAQAASAVGNGRSVTIQVNPSAGMNEAQLANEVTRRLNLLGA